MYNDRLLKYLNVSLSLENLNFADPFNAYVIKSVIEAERNWTTEDLNTANQSVPNSLSSIMESSAKDEAPSILYSLALKHNVEAKNNSQLRQALMEQLEENRLQLLAAEQQRDYWRQELQLLLHRYHKETGETVRDDEFTSAVNIAATNMEKED